MSRKISIILTLDERMLSRVLEASKARNMSPADYVKQALAQRFAEIDRSQNHKETRWEKHRVEGGVLPLTSEIER